MPYQLVKLIFTGKKVPFSIPENDGKVNIETTISELITKMRSLCSQVQDDDEGNELDIELYISGHRAEANKKLKDYNVGNTPVQRVTLSIKAMGGSERKIDFNHPKITKTQELDVLSCDNDNPRAKLPCGHVFTANSMHSFIKREVKKDYVIKIFCPFLDCKQEIEWSVACAVSGLNENEYIKYDEILEERRLYMSGKISKCPYCACTITKPEEIAHYRINCTACKNEDFCWACFRPWVGDGFTACGNYMCDANEEINKILQECEHIIPEHLQVEVPKIRACPKCQTLIQHIGECKHMHCKGCSTDFCFVCLSIKKEEDKKWICGEFTDGCVPAPKQKF